MLAQQEKITCMRVKDLLKEAPVSDWINLAEAQRILRVSKSTVFNMCNAGAIKTSALLIPGKTRGRRLYSRASILAFIEGGVQA